ncbi:hypothetical protein PFISCL1PPCAC_14390, partial [Pristionchus fissidentatus]
ISRMKLLIVLLLVGSASAQSAAFVTKFQNLVTNYLGANTVKAVDMIGQDALQLKTIDEMVSHLMKEVIGLVPASKYMGALGMLTNFQSCMSKAGSSMEKAMANIGAAFKGKLQPLYKKVIDKIKTMKTNKKADKAILTEGFKIATAGLTKALIQSVINVCMTKSTKAEYDCATPALNTIMVTSNYNMAYDAKRG